MLMAWNALKNSLDCRKILLPSEANGSNLSTSLQRPSRSRFLKSISKLREKPLGCNPQTIWSSQFPNPVTPETVLDDPACGTKTGALCISNKYRDRGNSGKDIGPTFADNPRPSTTDHSHRVHHFKPSRPPNSIIFDGNGDSHIC